MSASVFPARAGMSRLPRSFSFWAPSVPRASGDEPFRARVLLCRRECSPRERG